MQIRCWFAAGVLGLALPLMAQAQEQAKVNGRVVDAAGKPVAGAEVATFWYVEKNTMKPSQGVSTDAEGRFTLSVTFYGRGRVLLALDKDRRTGGLVLVELKDATKAVDIKLGPLVRVHGKFICKELDKRPAHTIVLMMSGPVQFAMCRSTDASFSFHLPPGTYKFWGYGTDFQDLKKDITLSADKPDLDMGTLDVPATIIARHKGKAPPVWRVTDARGVKKDVKLSDFKGKWVLIEFWGHW